MIPWMLVTVGLILLDIFFVGPLLFALWVFNADLLIILIVGVLAVLAPLICLMLEMNARRRYDVRCDVSYRIGEDAPSQKTLTEEDRLGYVNILDGNGKKTGVKEWRLMGLDKPVPKFSTKYIEQRRVWWGFWTTKHAHIVAISGPRGEEFEPMAYNPSTGDYTPALSGDKGLLFWKLSKDIENRNKNENKWAEYLPYIIIGGLVVLVAVFQFLTWLEMGKFVGSLSAAAENFKSCSDNYAVAQNATKKPTAQTPTTIGGIPIAGIG